MKPALLSLAALLFPMLACALPKAEWLKTTHDFGAFEENDGEVTAYFSFVNAGDEPLEVIAVRTSCGCTTSQPPKEAIMPGDTAQVSVTYNPKGRPGRFDRKVYVDMNTDPQRTALGITGVVIGNTNTLRSRYPVDAGEIKLRSTVVPFGEVRKGRIKSDFLEVYNSTSHPVTPRWENVPPYLKITATAPTIPAGEQIAYSMIFDSSKTPLYGIVSDSIMLVNGDYPPVKVEVIAMISEDFSGITGDELRKAPVASVSVKSVDFGDFPSTATTSRTFTIENTGKSELAIRRVYTTDPGVSVSVDKNKLKKGKSSTVTVTVEPSQLPAEILNARISVITNDPLNPVQNIRAVGFPTK